MISVKDLTFTHGKKIIFDSISFNIGNGQKIGLVGPNGAGKSTLFRLLTGQEQPRSGKITLDGTITMVPQEVRSDPALELAKNVRSFIDPDNKKDDYELLQIMDNMELFNVDIYKKVGNLSGGQKTKLAIIRALVIEPEILLLDEPTNFLDTKGKTWVMDFLSEYPKTLVLVSHDLALIDNVINKILAINPHSKKLEEYKGNYTKYKELKVEQEKHLERKIKVKAQQIKTMEKSLKTLYKYKSDKGVRQRVQLSKRIEKMKDTLPTLPTNKLISLTLPTPAWTGELPIRVINVSKKYDENQVLQDFSFSLVRGEKVALVGPNGAGKSTLIKIVIGQIMADAGEVTRDEKVKIGYYSQEFEALDMESTLMETLLDLTTQSENTIRSFLAGFMFVGERVFQSVRSLSGGEKTRLAIALLLLQNYNVLILDEPTTYLDVMSQRIILEALKKYTGAMIIVSHTEDFIKELKPNRVIFLPEQKIDHWIDGYLDRVSEV